MDTLSIIALVLLGWMIFDSRNVAAERLARIERRQAVLDRKVQLVMSHLGVVGPEPQFPEVVRLLDEGKKIDAIKAYRDATGAGLREAKDAVEAMQP